MGKERNALKREGKRWGITTEEEKMDMGTKSTLITVGTMWLFMKAVMVYDYLQYELNIKAPFFLNLSISVFLFSL